MHPFISIPIFLYNSLPTLLQLSVNQMAFLCAVVLIKKKKTLNTMATWPIPSPYKPPSHKI